MLAEILVANAHNTQPWRFDVGPDRIAIFADTSRHLGSFDPFRREMMLSLGCALENMIHVAKREDTAHVLCRSPGALHPAPRQLSASRSL